MGSVLKTRIGGRDSDAAIKVRISLCGRQALAEIAPFACEHDGVTVEFHGFATPVPADYAMRHALNLSKRYDLPLDVEDPRRRVVPLFRAAA